MPQGHRRSLRNYLLNMGLQLRFTAIIVALAAVLTGGLGYFVMSKAHEASRLVSVRAMDPTDELAQELVKQFATNDRILMAILVSFGFVLSLVLAAYGIVLTHKVAGPLFKVTGYLDKIRDGKLGVVYNLRKGDQLVEFFEHFKNAHDALRARTEEDIALIDKAIAVVGADPVGDELRAARARKEESLK
jgi:nitrogen fixation/metabolism regulation signal transduction histidine kinase